MKKYRFCQENTKVLSKCKDLTMNSDFVKRQRFSLRNKKVLQRNKKLAHKIERSQTKEKKKGAKKNTPEPQRRKTRQQGQQREGIKKQRNPPRWNRDWSWGSFHLKSIFHVGRCFQYKVKKSLRVLQEWMNLAPAYDDFTSL